jgi:biotin carboxylase
MAHLLIIDLPGGNDTDLIEATLAAGHRFSFITSDLALYRTRPAVAASLERADTLIEVPGFADAEVEQAVLTLHARSPIEAVLCLIDIRLVSAARIAERLGLRHICPATALRLRDKFSVRQRLQACGIAQPDFALATSNAEVAEAVQRLGLPVLIKPADGYGSQNIVVLRDELDLDPWLNPLDELLPSRTDYGLGVAANDRLLVERYMAGRFIGCDTFSLGGRHALLGVNDKLMFEAPSFAIAGGCFTPNTGQFAELQAHVFAVLDAVGFDCGATHMEIMLTADGPRLVEINPRLVGAKMPRLVSLALGRSMCADLIELHMGRWPAGLQGPESSQQPRQEQMPLKEEAAAQPEPQALALALAPTTMKSPGKLVSAKHRPLHAVSRWIVADRPGRLAAIELPDDGLNGSAPQPLAAGAASRPALRSMAPVPAGPLIDASGADAQTARIGCVELLKRPGDLVRPPLENADRIGYIMACGPTRIDAEALAEAWIAATRLQVVEA